VAKSVEEVCNGKRQVAARPQAGAIVGGYLSELTFSTHFGQKPPDEALFGRHVLNAVLLRKAEDATTVPSAYVLLIGLPALVAVALPGRRTRNIVSL
jgi:hypothetical protein